VSLYDPAFTSGDRELLGNVNFHLLQTSNVSSGEASRLFKLHDNVCLTCPAPQLTLVNGELTQASTGVTILFMPHCEKELYEATFRCNWTRSQLLGLIVIGNVLTDYLDR
jgi:hypothetical protein